MTFSKNSFLMKDKEITWTSVSFLEEILYSTISGSFFFGIYLEQVDLCFMKDLGFTLTSTKTLYNSLLREISLE